MIGVGKWPSKGQPALLSRIIVLAGLLFIALAVTFGAPKGARAQATEPTGAALLKEGDPEATLTYLNRPIVTFRATIAGITPAMRAERSYRRLVDLPQDILDQDIVSEPIEFAGSSGIILSIGGQPLFGIAAGDVDPEQLSSVGTLAAEAKNNLADAFSARLEQSQLPVLLRGFGLTALALAILAGLVWALWHLRLRIRQRFHAVIAHRVEKATAGKFDWTRYGYALTARLMQLATTFIILLLIYICLAFSLRQFPVMAPIGDRLRGFLIELISDLAASAAGSVPGIVTALVILLIAQALVQVTSNVIGAAEGGRVTLPIIKPDTASATKRLLRVIIWGAALAIAYPYIPGSDSAAFQGLSVMLGLMITLGSTGIVSQIMSGTVLVYSRALHPGEYVSTGDVEGVVTEMGAISTKLVTPQNEEVTIPNAVLVEATIKNYSRLFGQGSVQLSTKVTIGYDTPWRQVQAMLLMAAEQTEGLVGRPAPYVVQRALTDFYIEYELFALTDKPREQLTILSRLHSKIQDVFNEYGVQIMSPQYYEQPPQPLIVPKEKWYTAPARRE